jgi:hypothetical protein
MKHGDRFKLHECAFEDDTLWIDTDGSGGVPRHVFPDDAIQPDDVWEVLTDGDPIAGDCVIAVNLRSGVHQCIDGRWYCEECADLLDEYTLEEYEDWLVDEDDEQSDWPDPVY